jgi:hypothetical protein
MAMEHSLIFMKYSIIKNLFLLGIFFLGVCSCRQIVQPPQTAVTIPLTSGPIQTPDQPSSEELAWTARIVEDIPHPVPVLPPLKEIIQVLPPESWKIVVKKKQRKLLLFQQGELLKWYPIDLGENPEGPKVHQGDMKTPEGEYRIVEKKNQGQTKYYLAFLLDYPNDSDRIRYEQALKNNQFPGEIGIGGLIEIHGEGKGVDWTEGCIALINTHMQELFNQIPVGTTVRIEP